MNLELRKFRDNHNLTQQEMADRISTHRIKYVKIELGYQLPDIDFIKKMSASFNLSPKQVWQLFFVNEGSVAETKQTGTDGN